MTRLIAKAAAKTKCGKPAKAAAFAKASFAKRDPKVRRIVTTHDKNGKSVIWMDAYTTNHKYPNDRIISTLL